MEERARLRPSPAMAKMTLAEAWGRYPGERRLAEATLRTFRHCIRTCLRDWRKRSRESLGADRMGFRARMIEISRGQGPTTAVNSLKMFLAVYNCHLKVNLKLPECLSIMGDLLALRLRVWALTEENLHRWWEALQRRQQLRRVWWLMLLFTGARARSLCRLEWTDIDFEAGLIHFRATKGDRPHTVPMAERLRQALLACRDLKRGPVNWVFPNPVRPEALLHEGRDSCEEVAGVSPHWMRHRMRTRPAECVAKPDLGRAQLQHAMTRDISSGSITAKPLVETVRPLDNEFTERCAPARVAKCRVASISRLREQSQHDRGLRAEILGRPLLIGGCSRVNIAEMPDSPGPLLAGLNSTRSLAQFRFFLETDSPLRLTSVLSRRNRGRCQLLRTRRLSLERMFQRLQEARVQKQRASQRCERVRSAVFVTARHLQQRFVHDPAMSSVRV